MKGRITKLLILLAASILLPIEGNGGSAFAQTAGTISSYSRYGLGLLHEPSQGFNKSMGGVGLGVRIGNRVNPTNPASYSAIDSLSLIFDVGMTSSFGKMTQDAKSVGVNNASIDYVHVGMHIGKRLGLAFGYMPYTSIGYTYASPDQTITNDYNTTQAITSRTVYSGSGGLNLAYIGLGWRAYRNISVGANAGFLWGQSLHTLMPTFWEGGVASGTYSSTNKMYSASLRTFKVDLGVQYPVRLTRQDWLNLGATVGIGHKIPQDASLLLFSTKGDTTTFVANKPYDLPYTVGFGASWQHKNTLLVAADVYYELWGNCHTPMETSTGYAAVKGNYQNRTKVAVGTQYTHNPYGKYWERIQYRAGINYSTPYLKINEQNGPYELRLGLGAGLPIMNKINSRSVVNVGVQWLRRAAGGTGMIKEDYFVLNLGLTFNERWFMRYKIE